MKKLVNMNLAYSKKSSAVGNLLGLSFIAIILCGCLGSEEAPAPPKDNTALSEARSVAIEPASLLEAYVQIDRQSLADASEISSLANALLAIMDRKPYGADQLLKAISSEPAIKPELKKRLFYIATDQMVTAHRWDELLDVALDRNDQGLAKWVKPYAKWPASSLDAGDINITEVPFDGLHIPARLNGVTIKLAFDTGAPSVGVHHDFANIVTTDASSPQVFVLPAFDITAVKHHGIIESLEIGNFTFGNVSASVAIPPSVEDSEKFARMEQLTGRHDIIMGLDALRPFIDVVEFDYNRDVVRLIRKDNEPAAAPNMIMGDGRKPYVRLRTETRSGNYYIDTGSYGHLLGENAFNIRECDAQRTMKAPWREIIETRVRIKPQDDVEFEAWAQPSSLLTEPKWDVFGYLGNPRAGVYRLDLRDGRFELRNYESTNLDSLWPILDTRNPLCKPMNPK